MLCEAYRSGGLVTFVTLPTRYLLPKITNSESLLKAGQLTDTRKFQKFTLSPDLGISEMRQSEAEAVL
jgi:hypothetical protein